VARKDVSASTRLAEPTAEPDFPALDAEVVTRHDQDIIRKTVHSTEWCRRNGRWKLSKLGHCPPL